VVLGIHLGAHRFIGKSQPYPENTPSSIIRFVSNALDLGDGFVPLEYSDRERTRRQHAQITREFLGLLHFSADKHQNLIEYLIQKSPDPGHIQAWINNAEDFLRSNTFVLPSVKALRRLVLSARHQSMERVFLNVNAQVGAQREKCLDAMLSGQGEKGPFWNSFIDKNIFRATPAKLSEVLKRIKVIRELELENMDLSSIPDGYVRHLAQQGLRLSAKQLRDHKLSRRRALMTITLREMESELTDIAIQMNDEILAGVFQRGQSRSEKYLRKYRRVIQQVISAFRLMSDVILNESLLPHEMIESIKKKIQLDKLKILKKETDIIDVPRLNAGSMRKFLQRQSTRKIGFT